MQIFRRMAYPNKNGHNIIGRGEVKIKPPKFYSNVEFSSCNLKWDQDEKEFKTRKITWQCWSTSPSENLAGCLRKWLFSPNFTRCQ